MRKTLIKKIVTGMALVSVIFLGLTNQSQAVIPGVTGSTFNITVTDGHISSPDGGSIYTWGYGIVGSNMQYPGPTLIIQQGATVTITLKNELPAGSNNVSMVFPGQPGVAATGGVAGFLTREAPPDGTTVVTYTFVAAEPGTYTYYSGTNTDLQVNMGLVGAIIVRPTGFDPNAPRAYNHAGSSYDHEYLFLLTEMDPRINNMVEMGAISQVDTTDFFPVYWFINGRNAPDTLLPAGVPWLPNQPYNCLPRTTPGAKLLLRMVGGGRDLHPFHHHGNNAFVIARDGRLLSSATDDGIGFPDLSVSMFTIPVAPGSTFDSIFSWTGEKLGWDIYGTGLGFEHDCTDGDGDGFDDTTYEYCADHGKPLPVVLPEQVDFAVGGFWSGSPYLGQADAIPPGEGGLNPRAAFTFMWHSHNEKEMTNFDIFPGGLMTMMFVDPPGTLIP
ncbi:MAG: multicopper oxidase domain-containing protein [Deltaproteobacteria bacterium]|nr:multicopper oxidase domain-containing protein [Deltaproteobacteria bacterium]